MGYLRPTAIIVTGSYSEHAALAHREATVIFSALQFNVVTDLLSPATNGAQSFLVAWDGSKEGWDESDIGDRCRAEFIAWLREQAYDDGSSPLDWVEVQYGGDDREVIVLAHQDDGVASARPPLAAPKNTPESPAGVPE